MSKKINQEQIKHLAQITKITLSPTEIINYEEELETILNYMEMLNQLDTSDVTAIDSGLLHLELREDRIEHQTIDILQNVSIRQDNLCLVPKVIPS